MASLRGRHPEIANAVNRNYTITPNSGGSGSSAAVQLHYLDSELNGNTESDLVLWHYGGATMAQH